MKILKAAISSANFLGRATTRKIKLYRSFCITTLNMKDDTKVFSRLSKSVQPQNYNLSLLPCLKTFTFDGKQVVKVKVIASVVIMDLSCLKQS